MIKNLPKTTLQRLTRAEMFDRFQINKPIDDIVNAAYKKAEEERWRGQLDNAPHGNPWHTSFHASQFPGDDPMACPRKAMYTMMDLPPAEPFNRNARTIMEVGKGIEIELVSTFARAGILISANPDEEIQTGFIYADAWLTGSVDCVILPTGTTLPIPIEIKTKYQSAIDEMKNGIRTPDVGHVFQIKTQLALARHEQENGGLWSEHDLITHGYIYYLSRDKPSDTAEFRIDFDKRFFDAGISTLKQWKNWFIEDNLPSIDPSKKHPMGWKWSYPPCQWCNWKKTCKLDFEQGVTQLSESIGISRASLVNDEYDFDESRQRVLDRWNKKV